MLHESVVSGNFAMGGIRSVELASALSASSLEMMVRVMWVAGEQVIKLQDREQHQSEKWCDQGIKDPPES